MCGSVVIIGYLCIGTMQIIMASWKMFFYCWSPMVTNIAKTVAKKQENFVSQIL